MKNESLCFVVDDRISEAGHAVNEDIIGAKPSIAWVLDGASTQINYSLVKSTAASRLVAVIGSHLSDAKTASVDASTILRDAVKNAGTMLGSKNKNINFEEQAACSVGITLLRGRNCEICILGDITIVWQSADLESTNVYIDRDAIKQEKLISHEFRSLIASGKSVERARQLMWQKTSADRKHLMNRPGGYWNITIDQAAVEHAACYEISIKPGDHILIASDGFARLVDLFGAISWTEVMTILQSRQETLMSLVNRVRNFETDDLDCMKFPRMAPKDDASAIYLSIKQGGYR